MAAAAVVLPANFHLPGLTDSKRLSVGARERLAAQIKSQALGWGVALVPPPTIDRINILQASLLAMAKAVGKMGIVPSALLIDGPHRIPVGILAAHWMGGGTLPVQCAVVGGDALVPAISAASILAKTTRDKLMVQLARRWPGYGFERHKGYGTKEHLEHLARLGPCPLHRRSFRGVPPPADP